MAIRRPRIKAVANIGAVKRKIKSDASENLENKNKITGVELKTKDLEIKNESQNSEWVQKLESDLTKLKEENNVVEETLNTQTQVNVDGQINSPTKVYCESTQKPRQRIRPTPYFDIRRNSVTSSPSSNSFPPTSSVTANSTTSVTHADNLEKPVIKETTQPKSHVPSGNRTPNASRIHRVSESSSGGFLSPMSVHHNPPNFPTNHSHQQNDNNSSSASLSRDHIPPRYRKISSMEDTQKLSSARKEFQSKYSRNTLEKSALKLCDFIFYNPSSNPMVFETKQEKLEDLENEVENKENSDESKEGKDEESKNKEPEEECAPVPQLKLGPNGEIILDEKSLVIETTAEKQARSVLASSKSAIYLDEYSGNNGFYSRQKRTKDWSPEETIKFYRCLHTIGTDFSMMLSLFPNRSRRDLKLKFKKEERNNGSLVNKALLQPNAFDIDSLKNELAHEEEIAEAKRKDEHEKKIKFQKKIENKILDYSDEYEGLVKPYYSRAKNAMKKGDLAYLVEDNLSNNKKRKRKNKIKTELEDDINNKLSESINYIKNENSLMVGAVNKDEENEKDFTSETNEKVSSAEIDVDDIVSVNSINEFGYDEDSGVEITDIGDILTLEDTLPQFKDSTLAIVSKPDKNNTENVTHGIYIVCRSTGIMSQKPLDLPEDTVNCILKAVGKI